MGLAHTSTATNTTPVQPLPEALTRNVREVVRGFVGWLDAYGEVSQDQYDFWATRLGQRAKALYYRNAKLGTVAVAPFVVLDSFAPATRALVRTRSRFPIADAHYAMAFFTLARADGEEQWLERGAGFLEHLVATRCAQFDDYCWGYPFDWQTCFGVIPAGSPLITTTPYAYEAFERGYEVTGEPDYLPILESIGTFVFENIPAVVVARDVEACSYTPFDRRRVVNANAYRAFLLTAAGTRFGRADWTSAGERNLAFVLQCQREDGSWLYAVDGRDAFVDNFHTCFVLKNLTKIWRITSDETVLDAVRRGYAFYGEHLLDPGGDPKPFAAKPRLTLYRRDLYDYAEGVNLALLLEDVEPRAHTILVRLLDRLVEDWVLPDGHLVTRQLLLGRNKVPYHRWAQAQTFHALARVCERKL